jgi:hypothetical protein
MKAELRRNAFNTVRRIHVLDKSELIASCRTLPGDDGRVGEKILPDLKDSS